MICGVLKLLWTFIHVVRTVLLTLFTKHKINIRIFWLQLVAYIFVNYGLVNHYF